MRFPSGPLPRIGAGLAVVLLAPLIWLALGDSPSTQPGTAETVGRNPDDPFRLGRAAPQIPAEEIALLIARIESADPRVVLNGFARRDLHHWTPESYQSVTDALGRRSRGNPEPKLLELEVAILLSAIERDVPLRDPGELIRSLRQRAISEGGPEYFAAIARDLLRAPGIATWLRAQDRTAPGEILASAVLLDEPDLAARWADAILSPPGTELPSFELHAEWIRVLAELAGHSQDGRLIDILARATEPIEMERRPGASQGAARRLGHWIDGVQRLAAVEASRAGSANIGAAIESLTAALDPPDESDRLDQPLSARHRRRVTLDLARAQIAAARVRQRSAAPLLGAHTPRDRQLFKVGVNALLLDDRAELGHVLDQLAVHPEQVGASFYWELLRAGRARLDGGEGARERVKELLAADAARPPVEHVLYSPEAESWRRLAEHGRFSVAVDRPAVRFESGKVWAEFSDAGRPWLDRTLELLRTELTSRRDLAYLHFLESRIALGEGRIGGIAPRLLGLLDEGPPPGLSRAEIGALLVVLEEREDDLASADELRAAAAATLAPLAEDAAYDAVPEEVAQVLRLRLDLDQQPVGWLDDHKAARRLAEIEARFLRPGGLPFELESARLALRDVLFERVGAQQSAGALELARTTLVRVRHLSGGSIVLLIAEAEAERGLAAATPEDLREDSVTHHRAAGRAFRAAARLDPSQTRLHLEASRSFLAAGDLDEARDSVEEFAPVLSRGERDDGPAWDALLLSIRIEREAGNMQKVIILADSKILDQDATYPVLETLLIEKAGALEAVGRDAPALEVYDRLIHDLRPSSSLRRTALLRRAQVLERRIPGLEAPAESEIRAARDAWAEAASWLLPTEGTAEAAIARHHAAEHSLVLGDPATARRHLESLFADEDAFRSGNPPLEERRLWDETAEKALYTLGDAWRMEGDAQLAEDAYQRAIERYPSSVRVPFGYLMLGEIARERGDHEVALGLYRRGERKAEALASEVGRVVPVDLRQELRSRIRLLEADVRMVGRNERSR